MAADVFSGKPVTLAEAMAALGGGPAPLPALRDDLELLPGPRGLGGQPTWTIHDPVRNRFLRMEARGIALLSAWHLGDRAAVAEAVGTQTGTPATEDEIAWMERFLRSQSLVREDGAPGVARLTRIAGAARTSWISWVLHRYLYIRLPLVRPDRFLDATLPLVRPLMTRTAAVVVVLLGLVGVLLALRQWSTFQTTFMHFFDLSGAIWFAAALAVSKVVHELGHAYTAKRLGCRVPTMGVALLVLWPVLYTDTTDTWRLTDRRQRVAVGVAGMTAELALAAIATALWSFLPDGPARSAAFLMATVTWVMTLVVNLNPLMRFDGYYLLSDALGVENLQDRAFAQGRWALRRILLGLDDPPPEPLPGRLRGWLIAFAYLTWIWRFFLYLGIALLVYHLAFKALGVFLFAVEMVWFILRPLSQELRVWWTRRHDLTWNRHVVATLGGLGVLFLGLAVPWPGTGPGLVSVPAMERAATHAWLFAPVPARLESLALEPGARVAAGQVLAQLEAPDLAHHIAQARRRIAIQEALVLRQAADAETADNINVLRRQLVAERTRLDGLLEEQRRLTVTAPHAGVIGEAARGLRPGLWVSPEEPLGVVVDDRATVFQGYVREADRERLAPGRRGTFYPGDPTRDALPVEVVDLAPVNAAALDQPALTAPFGGPLAARVGANGAIVPEEGLFRVTLRPLAEVPAPAQALPGVARLEAEPRSILGRLWRHAWAVLVRESGL